MAAELFGERAGAFTEEGRPSPALVRRRTGRRLHRRDRRTPSCPGDRTWGRPACRRESARAPRRTPRRDQGSPVTQVQGPTAACGPTADFEVGTPMARHPQDAAPTAGAAGSKHFCIPASPVGHVALVRATPAPDASGHRAGDRGQTQRQGWLRPTHSRQVPWRKTQHFGAQEGQVD